MSLEPQQLDIFSQPVVEIYNYLENELFQLIVSRIANNRHQLTKDTVLEWQITKYNELHEVNHQMIKEIARYSHKSEKEVSKLFKTITSKSVYDFDAHIDKAIQQGYIERTQVNRANLDSLMLAFQEQAKKSYAFVNQTLIHQSKQAYTRILDDVVSSVAAGLYTPEQAISQALNKFAKQGIPALVDKAGKQWSTDSYIRLITRSSVNNIYNQQTINRMDDYNIDLVLISSHVGARPLCAPYQGKIYDRTGRSKKYPDFRETSYGHPAGILGCNCRHHLIPYIEGFTVNNFVVPSSQENNKVYELTQRQRYLERRIRQAKKELFVAKELQNHETVATAKQVVSRRQKEIRTFVKENDLARMYEREKLTTNAV